jgi:hypothetical protein
LNGLLELILSNVHAGELPRDVTVCREGEESWTPIEAFAVTDSQGEPDSSLAAPPTDKPPAIRNREYTVVPFVAAVGRKGTASHAASQLETLIQSYARNGWEYVRLEQVETYVGEWVFGFGGTPGHATHTHVSAWSHR